MILFTLLCFYILADELSSHFSQIVPLFYTRENQLSVIYYNYLPIYSKMNKKSFVVLI